jgi:hypothetical protein
MNGFSGAVQVALNALPAGVTSNPASSFSVAPGASTPVVFGASANAATGNFTISVQGTSGALSHSASLAVAIQSAMNPAQPMRGRIRLQLPTLLLVNLIIVTLLTIPRTSAFSSPIAL